MKIGLERLFQISLEPYHVDELHEARIVADAAGVGPYAIEDERVYRFLLISQKGSQTFLVSGIPTRIEGECSWVSYQV